MTDDVKALIAEARTVGAQRQKLGRGDLMLRLADALEAATSAPAVDREALVEFFDRQGLAGPNVMASEIIASGILHDAAEFEARGLEKGWDEGVKWLLVYDGGIYPEVADELHANPYRRGSE